MVQSGQCLLYKHEALSYVPRTHTKMLVFVLHALKPNSGETRRDGSQGLACLPVFDELVSSRPTRDSVSEDTRGYSLDSESTHTNTHVPEFRRRMWGREVAQEVKVLQRPEFNPQDPKGRRESTPQSSKVVLQLHAHSLAHVYPHTHTRKQTGKKASKQANK